MVGIVLRSRMERWWFKVDKQCACLLCVGEELCKRTRSSDECGTRDCMIGLTELVAAVVKGCVGIHMHQIRWVSSHQACRRLCYRTPRSIRRPMHMGILFPLSQAAEETSLLGKRLFQPYAVSAWIFPIRIQAPSWTSASSFLHVVSTILNVINDMTAVQIHGTPHPVMRKLFTFTWV